MGVILYNFFLTFDTEDFISKNSIQGLLRILDLLKKYELKSIFFITGHMIERLSYSPLAIDLLGDHEIGYHSSSHSVHPTIFEFTDVESYKGAYQNSLIRETAHINPLTGKVEGVGGIIALKSFFPQKKIVAFRAPGYCWTPPHLEALKDLGIVFDFSTRLSSNPISYKGITFYPFTVLSNWQGGIQEQSYLQRLIMKHKTSVLTIHPSSMINQLSWDSIYYPSFSKSKKNPPNLTQLPPRTPAEIASIFYKFELLLKHLKMLQKINFIKVTPELKIAKKTLNPTLPEALISYRKSLEWAEGFEYKPTFLCNHFTAFFDVV
jgi:hypothetical protein